MCNLFKLDEPVPAFTVIIFIYPSCCKVIQCSNNSNRTFLPKEEHELSTLEKFIFWEKFADLTALYWSAVSDINGVAVNRSTKRSCPYRRRSGPRRTRTRLFFTLFNMKYYFLLIYCSLGFTTITLIVKFRSAGNFFPFSNDQQTRMEAKTISETFISAICKT